MILNIYTIKDKLSDFGPLYTAETDDMAKRSYIQVIKDNPFRKDLDLYKIGIYNTEKGQIIANKEQEKLMEGEVYAAGENQV